MKNPKAKTALKVVHRNDRAQTKRVLAGSGQALLPMLERLEGAQASIDELIHETAVALADQLLVLSAQELAGVKQRGREGGPVLWHGAQRGVVALAERQLRVQRQRLHDKNGRDVSQLCCPAAAGTAGSPRARCPGASPKPVPRSWPHSTSAAWLSCPCWCWPSSRRWLQWRYARRPGWTRFPGQ